MTDDTDERGEEYVARQRGGDHLPECPVSKPAHSTARWLCICAALRACEARVERVTRKDDNRALWDNRQWNAALDAARDAVAALPHYSTQITVSRASALAAIDALKGATDD